MSTSIKLRPYQTEAIDAVFDAWSEGNSRPSVVLSTGAGKTVIFSALIERFIKENGHRVMVLVHRDELADQTVNKLKDVTHRLQVGRVKAQDDQVHHQVMVCSVQTLARQTRRDRAVSAQRIAGKVGLIVTDECHHSLSPSYGRVYEAFPEALNAGFTATLARGDNKGLGSVWSEPVYTKSLPWMIKNGFLVPPRGITVKVDDLDLGAVRKTAGDYRAGDLGDAIEKSSLIDTVVRAYREHAWERPGIVFTPTVETARHMADAFTRAGLKAESVWGETPRDERRRIYEDFRTGKTRVLTSCMVLTEGFDAPHASCAVIARPTQSQPLYVQMVGRVLRLFPGKSDALVIDAVGASQTNKLKMLVDLDPDLFEQASPCEECDRTPCVCPCKSCGQPKPCQCPKEERPEVQTKGTGGSIDLFAASTQAWLQTKGGVLFIPVGDGSVFLWGSSKEAGAWDVYYAPKDARNPSADFKRLHESLPLGTAMAWAETEADACMPFSTKKTASWRRRKATEAQLSTCKRFGIPVSADMSSGDVGNALSVFFASRQFDRYLKRS